MIVGEMIVGEMIVGEMIVDEMIASHIIQRLAATEETMRIVGRNYCIMLLYFAG